jgi:hypothetical protein
LISAKICFIINGVELRGLFMRRKSILKPSAKPKQKPKVAQSIASKNSLLVSNNDSPSTKRNISTMSARKTSGSFGTRGIIGIEQTITIVQKTILRQETPFAESCLPRTMKIALESRELLLPLLRSYPSSWSFIDKIFVMLASVFREDVAKFYANKELCMAKIYSSMQIERFDKILARDLLEKIEALKLKNKSDNKIGRANSR